MTADSPISAPHPRFRTRAARLLIMLGGAVQHALFVEATWLEPRFGTGELKAPPPPRWAVRAVHDVKAGVEVAILGLLLAAVAWAACAAFQTVTVWGGRP